MIIVEVAYIGHYDYKINVSHNNFFFCFVCLIRRNPASHLQQMTLDLIIGLTEWKVGHQWLALKLLMPKQEL